MPRRFYNVLLMLLLDAFMVCGLRELCKTPPLAIDNRAKSAPLQASGQRRPEQDWWNRRGKWSVSAIQVALGRLSEISDLERKSEGLKVLMRRWTALDGQGAFEYARSLEDWGLRRSALKAVAEILARSDPRLLADLLAARDPDNNRELIHLLANTWSQSDVQSAFAWAERLPEGACKADALVIIGSLWVSQNPETASPQIGRLPHTSATANLITTVGSYWGATDPDQGIEWVAALPETKQTLALSSLLGAWAQRDPVAAGNYLAQLPPGPMQDEASRSVVASWSKQNPSQAAAWVLQFSAGDSRDQDFRVIVNDWNNLDPVGVENWARNLPEGQTRDSVLKDLVTTLAYSNPNQAVKMAGLINSPTEQQQALASLALVNLSY